LRFSRPALGARTGRRLRAARRTPTAHALGASHPTTTPPHPPTASAGSNYPRTDALPRKRPDRPLHRRSPTPPRADDLNHGRRVPTDLCTIRFLKALHFSVPVDTRGPIRRAGCGEHASTAPRGSVDACSRGGGVPAGGAGRSDPRPLSARSSKRPAERRGRAASGIWSSSRGGSPPPRGVPGARADRWRPDRAPSSY
jgi:hypothetical protein